MGVTVYLDSCIVIYLVEEHPEFAPIIESLLAQYSDILLAVSPLTEMECLVLPLRQKNEALMEKFRQWFRQVKILSMDREIFQSAGRFRARFPAIKTPDAIHLAAALHHGVSEFWTNDQRLDIFQIDHLVKNVIKQESDNA
jgi:predicted nucleic acid-binding protein